MAWRAWVASNVEATPDGQLWVTIHYYDDADPANANVSIGPPLVAPVNVLWLRSWSLPIGSTTAQLRAAVVAEGQRARDWVAARDSARVAVPAGTTVAIP